MQLSLFLLDYYKDSLEISKLQKIDIEKNLSDPNYKPKIRIAIATARNAPYVVSEVVKCMIKKEFSFQSKKV